MVDKEISEIAINHIDKKLKERIDELTALNLVSKNAFS